MFCYQYKKNSSIQVTGKDFFFHPCVHGTTVLNDLIITKCRNVLLQVKFLHCIRDLTLM